MVPEGHPIRCYLCKELPTDEIRYMSPPPGETRFLNHEMWYPRSYSFCAKCLHWTSSLVGHQSLDYEREYASSTYGSQIRENFEKIMSLPEHQSDNQQRVKWLEQKIGVFKGNSPELTVLDIGSGLGVFPYLLAQHGWRVTALEPNLALRHHLESLNCFRVWGGDLSSLDTSETFDLITLNKVLEHVADPLGMLGDIQKRLSPQGALYVEVPDGEGAVIVGQDREEFFVEHLHVFSLRSLQTMLKNASYLSVESTVLREPSGKFTIRQLSRK